MADTNEQTSVLLNGVVPTDSNIDFLFRFPGRNHETKGYDDALINADVAQMEQNVQALENESARAIFRIKTFNEKFIWETDFHIDSRIRSGMVIS